MRIAIALAAIGLLAIGAATTAVAQRAVDPQGKQRRPGRPRPAWDRETLEIFFEDARERLGPGTEPSGVPLAADRPPATATPDAVPSAEGAGDGVRWSELVTAEAIEDEVKSLAAPLAATVQNPSGFKSGAYREARAKLSWLAALFRIAGAYDGQVRWHDEGAALAAAFGRAGLNCKTASDNAFSEARDRSGDLTDLIRGGKVDVGAADPDAAWNDTANRPPLMQRMEQAQQERIGPWTAGSVEFSRNRDALAREAQLLLAVGEILKDSSYEFADDEAYRTYVDEMQAQARTLWEAARDYDFQRAQSAAAQIGQSCTACHGDFRG